ncbi:MAG: ATP-dependent DNA helicase RecG [Sporichthyaceae bacterium]
MKPSGHHPLGTALHLVIDAADAKKLEKHLGMTTVGDLLRHYPRRYEKRGELTPLAALELGADVTVVAKVLEVKHREMAKRKGWVSNIVVTDGTSKLRLVFFGKWAPSTKLKEGDHGLFAGKVSVYNDERQLAQPAFTALTSEGDESEVADKANELIPIYSATAKVPSWDIKDYVGKTLEWLDSIGELPDPLPAELCARERLQPLVPSLKAVHRPADYQQAGVARKRLRWEEAFVLQCVLAERRTAARARPGTPRKATPDGLLAAFDARLPFELTKGQREIGAEIARELAAAHPMHRLLQGEVGSGKTLVALRAMLAVVDAGGQAALLAPTEVLAVQHHRSLTALLGPLAQGGMLGGGENATRIALLTGSSGAAARKQALLDAASGEAGIVVGTHALLEDRVAFFDLGLVVVDEQHRFGVEQRDKLRAKGERPPHVLVMTATPIPRTVAITVFGDLDISTLEELPAGRSPIETYVVPADNEKFVDRTWARVREEVAAGHQAYVVCPRIGLTEEEELAALEAGADDGQDRRPAAAVLDVVEELRADKLNGLRVEMVHGRLPADEKDAVMRAFTAGEIDVLVATTVIEVGVDVPNATVMAIVDADRFGISQLHQLRGRVGRGTAKGLCLLVTGAPPDSPAGQRLAAVASTNDGFELSRLDLESRREGDVLGSAQSGTRSSLRVLSVLRDAELIAQARDDAEALLAQDPSLGEHPDLAAAMADLFDPARAGYIEKA